MLKKSTIINVRKSLFLILLFMSLLLTACANRSESAANTDYRIIKDMWDREVQVKNQVDRVVIIEWEGLAAKSMKAFGVEEKIVGVDDYAKKNIFRSHIVPTLQKVPDIGSAWSGVNYETLAKLKPDVVFMELWVTNESDRELHKTAIDKIEGMGIPVITFLSPSCYENPDIKTAWRHISIVGEVLNKQAEAQSIVDRLNESIELIKSRTADIPENEKANAVVFATSNYVMGKKSIQSYFLTEIINANNLVPSGDFVKISEEQLIKLDPDVMIVNGHDGYLDPSIIYQGKMCGINWANVKDMRAVKNKRMISLGYEEWRATFETPVALLKMAKTIYPEGFEDIDLEAEEIKMYMTDYGFNEEEAKKAIEAQRYTSILDVK